MWLCSWGRTVWRSGRPAFWSGLSRPGWYESWPGRACSGACLDLLVFLCSELCSQTCSSGRQESHRPDCVCRSHIGRRKYCTGPQQIHALIYLHNPTPPSKHTHKPSSYNKAQQLLFRQSHSIYYSDFLAPGHKSVKQPKITGPQYWGDEKRGWYYCPVYEEMPTTKTATTVANTSTKWCFLTGLHFTVCQQKLYVTKITVNHWL